MRRWLRILTLGIGLFVLLLALASAALWAVVNGAGRERLRAEAEVQLSQALGVPVAIESIGGVLTRELELRGLRIGPGEGRSARLALSELRLEWTPAVGWPEWLNLALLGHDPPPLRLSVERLRLAGLRLRLVRGEPLPWESAEPTEDSGAGPAIEVALNQLALADAEVEWIDPEGASLDFSAEGTAEALASDARGFRVGALALAGSGRGAPGVALAGPGGSLAVVDPARRRELARYVLRGGLDWSAAESALAWRAERLELDGSGVRVEGHGAGDSGGVGDAQLDFEVASLSSLLDELAPLLRTQGEATPALAALRGDRVDGHLTLAGRWESLLGDLRFDARSLAYQQRKLGDLRLAARADSGSQLRVQAFELRGGELALRAQPGAVLRAHPETWQVEGLDLVVAETGRLRVAGHLPRGEPTPGAPAAPEDWGTDPRLTLALEAERLPLSQLWKLVPPAPDGPALRLEAATLDAKLRVAGGAQGLAAKGWAEAAAAEIVRGDLQAQTLAGRIEFAGPIAHSRGKLDLTIGAIEAKATAQGGLTAVLAFTDSSRFEVERLEWNDGSLPLRALPGSRFQLTSERLRLEDFRAESGEQRLLANGSIHFGGEAQPSLRGLAVEVEALSLGWVRERLREAGVLGPDVTVAGALTGVVRASGPVSRAAIEAELVAEGLESAGVRFERVTLDAKSPGDRIEVVSRWERAGESALRFELEAVRQALAADPLAIFDQPSTRFVFQADRFDLAVLEAFAPARVDRLQGVLEADVAIRGGAPAQVERGHFAMHNGGVLLKSPKQSIGPIDAEGALRTGAVVIERLAIGPPGARILGEATIDELGSGDERLSGVLRFVSYPFKISGIAKAQVNGKLELDGRVSAPSLDGKLVLSKVEIWLPDANAPELKEILVSTGSGPDDDLSIREGEDGPGVLDRVAYNIAVVMERGSWARGRGVEAELTGSLRLEKRARGRESYSGELRTVRGTYEVYGRRFEIERGLATLDGASQIDPVLDIEARHRVRTIEVNAFMSGRLSDPILRFESNPELSQTDIASYLLIGRPAATARGEDAVAVQTTAARLATGLVSSELERVLAPVLPVDVIDVRVDREEDEDALALGVGKYIGERLFLRYDRRFGREATDEFRAEYELTDRWSIESSAATNGEAGGDLIFNIEY